MRPSRLFVPADFVAPARGIDKLRPSTMLPVGFSPEAQNVSVRDQVVERRTGYTLVGSALTGTVMALLEYTSQAGVRTFIAVTTERVYAYLPGSDSWSDVSIRKTKFKFAVAGTFTTGEKVTQATSLAEGIYLSKDATYVYIQPTWGTFNKDDTITGADSSATATAHGTPEVDANGTVIALTGDVDDPVDYTIGTDVTGRYVIVTNGVDRPIYWDGVAPYFKTFVPNLTGFVTCKTLAVYRDYLVLGNVTTTSVDAQSVAWSDTADFFEFATGNADIATLPDCSGGIVMLMPLADRLVVYADSSIGLATHVGGEVLFSFEQLIRDTRLVSGLAVVNLGPFHVFLNEENIYLFDGTRLIRPIGDPIRTWLRSTLYHPLRGRTRAELDVAHRQVRWLVPTNPNESIELRLDYDVYDLSSMRWTIHGYPIRHQCYGLYTGDASILWSTVVSGSDLWSAEVGPWNERADYAGRQTLFSGGTTGVYSHGEADTDDAGTAITSWWDSPDYSLPQEYKSELARWIELEFDAKGTTTEVWYSTDQGATWTVLSATVTLTTDWSHVKLDMDTTGDTVRFRFYSNATSDFALRWLRVWFKPGGRR